MRQNDWQWGITVQQEVIPRMSVEVAYNRRWFQGAKVTDNTLRGPDGLRAVSRSRRRRIRGCPDGGGYPIALYTGDAGGLRSRRAELRHVRNATSARSATDYWDGVDFTLNARLRQGLNVQVGTQTGRSVDRHVRDRPVIDGGSLIKDLRSCRDVFPFQTTCAAWRPTPCPRSTCSSAAPCVRSPRSTRRHLGVSELADPERHRTAAAGVARVRQHDGRHPGHRPSAVCRQSTDADRHALRQIFRFGRTAWTSASISATC